MIAGFRVHGVPVLVGDVLITRSRAASPFVPTAPPMAGQRPLEVGTSAPDPRKKVHIIGPNLAIGWSGWAFAARVALKKIHDVFSSKRATKNELEDVLSTLTQFDEERFSVHLIGWFFDGEPCCFRWNSQYPGEIFPNDFHLAGTGEELFKDVLTEPVAASEYGGGIGTAKEAAIFWVLAKLCKLINREVWTGDTLGDNFGYCYEIAILDGSTFRYLESFTYLMWDVQRASGGYQWRMGPVILKYQNRGDFSLVQTVRFEASGEMNIFLEIVRPVFDDMAHLDPFLFARQPIVSEFFCNFVQFTDSKKRLKIPFVVHKSDQTFMGHQVKDGKCEYWLNIDNVMKRIGTA